MVVDEIVDDIEKSRTIVYLIMQKAIEHLAGIVNTDWFNLKVKSPKIEFKNTKVLQR